LPSVGFEELLMEWMNWTTPTAAFFGAIALLLTGMTTWEVRSPSIPRRGFLPISTTRGDRLFIGLLGSAYLHLLVIGVTGWSIWVASALSLVWLLAVMRWG
jgi:predicted small integral membrane protein